MSTADQALPHAEDAKEQIARLRAQVETLMKERVTPAVSNVAERAESALGAVKGQAERVTGHVKEQPVAAVLIAAAVGFALGRMLR